jgi:hypothetical protein
MQVQQGTSCCATVIASQCRNGHVLLGLAPTHNHTPGNEVAASEALSSAASGEGGAGADAMATAAAKEQFEDVEVVDEAAAEVQVGGWAPSPIECRLAHCLLACLPSCRVFPLGRVSRTGATKLSVCEYKYKS